MPDVAAIRRRLPIVLNSSLWFCCGDKGIAIVEAVGESQWKLIAFCLTCKCELVISKHGVFNRDHGR